MFVELPLLYVDVVVDWCLVQNQQVPVANSLRLSFSLSLFLFPMFISFVFHPQGCLAFATKFGALAKAGGGAMKSVAALTAAGSAAAAGLYSTKKSS